MHVKQKHMTTTTNDLVVMVAVKFWALIWRPSSSGLAPSKIRSALPSA